MSTPPLDLPLTQDHPALVAAADVVARVRTDAPLRASLAETIGPASGLHPASVEALLLRWCDGFRADAFVARARTLADTRVRVRGPVVIVAPSNLPVAAWTASLEALTFGLDVRLRPGSGDPQGPPALEALLRQVAPALASRLRIVRTTRTDDAAWNALLGGAGAVVAFGADASLDALAARIPPSVPLRRHGSKVSLGALVGPPAVGADAIVQGLLDDALLADGRGCLSLRAIWVAGTVVDAEAWATRLAEQAGAAARRWPAGRLDLRLAAAARLAIESDRLDAALGGGRVFAGDALVVSVRALAPGERLDAAAIGPGAGLLRVFAVAPERSPAEFLAPLAGHLAAVSWPGAEGFALGDPTGAGFYAHPAPGWMQSPRWDCHDGIPAGQGLFEEA